MKASFSSTCVSWKLSFFTESTESTGFKKPKWVAKVGDFFSKLGPNLEESNTRNEVKVHDQT
jgi:hypothetical protein